MNYRKLDAALAGAMNDATGARDERDRRLPVFIHLQPEASDEQRAALVRMGVSATGARSGIATANLSPREVRHLSDQPWVQQLRLSTPLRLLRRPLD